MRIIKLIFILTMIPLTTFANDKAPSTIEGKYICKGYDFVLKKPYEEKGELKRTGNTYSFTRTDISQGIFYATGLVKNSIISFIFWNTKDTSNFGLASYQLLPNGDLKGNWTVKNSKIVGEDYCKRIN